MTVQSGGNFGLGAITVGEIGLNLFQKRPDPKRKLTALRPNCDQKTKNLAKANFHTLWTLKTDHTTHIELNEASKQDGHSTSNAKICSKTPSFQQSIQANNAKEGSQSLSEKLKSGKKVAAATTGDFLVNLDLWVVSSLKCRLSYNKCIH